jgi:DNA adenine methylase
LSRNTDRRPKRAQLDLFASGEPVVGSLSARATSSARTARLPLRDEPATPFLKWAGGKTQLLGQLIPLLPGSGINRYHEPFIGGGALFFAVGPPRSYLSDLNPDLVNCYQVIRGQVEDLIEALDEHVYEQEYYYEIRAQDPRDLGDVDRAARFIYLNRTCFNGLHRVNRKGQFNVPFGRYSNPTICDADNLRRVASALRSTTLQCAGFEKVLDRARAGDLVYFDPPYQPISATSSFTSYTSSTFGPTQQAALADVFCQLDRKGVKVMLSNSDAQFIRDLYEGFEISEVQAHRNINRDAARRGPITELVVRNFRG